VIDLPVIRSGLFIGTIHLDSKEIVPEAKNPVYFKCQSHTDCCSSMKIPASTHDIDRILEQGYELDQIIQDLTPIILNPNAPQGPREKAYILKRKPFDGTCTFLEDNLCSIHQFKPFACRIYPFELDFVDDHTIRVLIHQKQLCTAITAAEAAKSNNSQILRGLFEIIENELEERGYPVDMK
jgi:Fe-S-cluster containining protein